MTSADLRAPPITPKRWLAAWAPALIWAAVLFGLSSIPGTKLPNIPAPNIDKVVHAGVYVVLGMLCLRGLRRTSPLTGARAVILATCLAALYGVSDELHQFFTPNRSPDWHDAAADAAGGLVGALVAAGATRGRRGARGRAPPNR
jgi:VanZ family protein